jgi:hypothetical protein
MAKKWDEVVLSTTASIARYESEINDNAGTKSVSGLLFNGTDTINLTSSLATSVQVYYSNGTSRTDTPTVYIITPTENDEIIKVKILAGATAYVGSILSLTEGKGADLYDQYYQKCGITDATWTFFEIARSWNDKIEIAKEVMTSRIKSYMIERGRNEVVVQNGGDELLDSIYNPDVFSQASDLLTLKLIYEDMAGMGTNDFYYEKANNYDKRYERAFQEALTQFQYDPTFSGTPIDNARIKGQLIF